MDDRLFFTNNACEGINSVLDSLLNFRSKISDEKFESVLNTVISIYKASENSKKKKNYY